MQMKHLAVALIALSITAPVAASKRQKTLEEEFRGCQKVHQKIESLEQHRRAGGSAATMDKWRRQINAYQDQFSERRCLRFRNRLR